LFSLMITFGTIAQTTIKDANAEVRNVKNFHAIKVQTGIELVLNQGKEEAVAVSANSVEHRNNIKTVVENGVLKIYYDTKIWKNSGNRRLKAYVSIINIDDIDISSGATVKVDGDIRSSSLGLDVSSGGEFRGKVNVDKLVVDQSSGATINISGTAGTLKIDGSSGSSFNGYDLAVDNATADVSSGSGVNVTVNKELNADASSGGSVHYKGNGVIKSVKTGSGGGVSKR
ncbi:MAG: head GIN domain-containing protein, partial [Flavitalea sp.]